MLRFEKQLMTDDEFQYQRAMVRNEYPLYQAELDRRHREQYMIQEEDYMHCMSKMKEAFQNELQFLRGRLYLK